MEFFLEQMFFEQKTIYETPWEKLDPPWLRFSEKTGDMLALSGAGVWLSELHGEITIPVTKRYETNVRSIYASTPKAKVVPMASIGRIFNDEGVAITPGLSLSIGNGSIAPRDSEIDYYEHIYNTLGVPSQERWNSCPLEKASKLVSQKPVPKGEYIFVHDDPSRDYHINPNLLPDIPVYPLVNDGDSILSFADVIYNAIEGHVMDSSFFWLAEHLPRKGKWYLHRYVKSAYLDVWSDFKRKQEWTIINGP